MVIAAATAVSPTKVVCLSLKSVLVSGLCWVRAITVRRSEREVAFLSVLVVVTEMQHIGILPIFYLPEFVWCPAFSPVCLEKALIAFIS
jgi:hypothetical protein